MELRQLRHFLAVIDNRSITRAAATLRMTQPALSQSLKSLERSVGAELLLRSGGGVRPSDIGEAIEPYARNIVREADKALARAAELRGSGPGALSIGLHSIFERYAGAEMIGDLMSVSPELRLEIGVFTSGAEDVARRVQEARLDIALTVVAPDWTPPAEVIVSPVAQLRSQIYCRPDHPLAAGGRPSPGELADYDWAVTRVGLAEALIAAAFTGRPQAPRIKVRTDSMTVLMALTEAQPLLCLIPESVAAGEVAEGRLVMLEQDLIRPESTAAVIYSALVERTPAMRRLASFFARRLTVNEARVADRTQ